MMKWIKRLGLLIVVLGIAAAFYYAMKERPALVDVALAESGPMAVTIDAEGITRVRDVYVVSSPITGHLSRVTLEEGAPVASHTTIVASIHPLDPPFIDTRTRSELLAAVEAAKSAIALAEVELQRAQTALKLAESAYDRADRLAKTNVVSVSALEKALSDVELQTAQVASAEATIRLRQAELESAKARLVQPSDVNVSPEGSDCCIDLTAPVDGIVLKVIARSEQAVSQGTPIAEIGNPADLEITVDLLSRDATRIQPGDRAVITEWGGEADLEATVRRIDPAGFTKISALGIEEQRVNAILDFTSAPGSLGHGYRVLAKLVIWSADDVLQVPISALFRSGGTWSVFAVREGVAELTAVSIGQMNASHAQLLEGLEEGDTVILYPNDLIEDGSLVEER